MFITLNNIKEDSFKNFWLKHIRDCYVRLREGTNKYNYIRVDW